MNDCYCYYIPWVPHWHQGRKKGMAILDLLVAFDKIPEKQSKVIIFLFITMLTRIYVRHPSVAWWWWWLNLVSRCLMTPSGHIKSWFLLHRPVHRIPCQRCPCHHQSHHNYYCLIQSHRHHHHHTNQMISCALPHICHLYHLWDMWREKIVRGSLKKNTGLFRSL